MVRDSHVAAGCKYCASERGSFAEGSQSIPMHTCDLSYREHIARLSAWFLMEESIFSAASQAGPVSGGKTCQAT